MGDATDDGRGHGLRGISTRGEGEGGHTSDNATSRFMMQGQRETTELSSRFFGKANLAELQAGIQRGVYARSNGRFRVGPQNETNIQIVMQHIYFEEAYFIEANVGEQLRALNAKVLEYCVENVYKNYISYAQYRHDSETIRVPIQRPECSRADQSKTLEFKGWF